MDCLLCGRVPHTIQSQLGEVFRTIVYNDYPEKWPTLLPELCASLASQVRREQPCAFAYFTYFSSWFASECVSPVTMPRQQVADLGLLLGSQKKHKKNLSTSVCLC